MSSQCNSEPQNDGNVASEGSATEEKDGSQKKVLPGEYILHIIRGTTDSRVFCICQSKKQLQQANSKLWPNNMSNYNSDNNGKNNNKDKNDNNLSNEKNSDNESSHLYPS